MCASSSSPRRATGVGLFGALLLLTCGGLVAGQVLRATPAVGPRATRLAVDVPVAGPATAATPNPDVAALAAGNTAFAVDLYRAQSSQAGNLFFSPYSVSVALAMTYAGARGNTAAQMARTLHFDVPADRLHPAFRDLAAVLASRSTLTKREGTKGATGFQLNVANALWGQRGQTFLPTFLDLVSANYGGGLRQVDFRTATEDARQTINGWVSDQTKERIKDLLQPGVLNGLTRLVLTNAVYFLAGWETQFDPKDTRDGTFTLLDGKQTKAPMMHVLCSLGYAKGGGWQAVALPYVGRDLAMVAIMPDAGTWPAFEKGLSAGRLNECRRALRSQRVRLAMPRFSSTSTLSLGDALSKMGMADAFGGEADFSGMTGQPDLHISAVLHKAFVKVNEEGTEAAAATAVVMSTKAMPSAPVVVELNRPFWYAIVDQPTGTVVFMGRVLNPAG